MKQNCEPAIAPDGQRVPASVVAAQAGRRTGLERRLDSVRDELRGLRVDDDVPAAQHPADHLPPAGAR